MRAIMQRKRRRNKGERESDLVLPVFTNYIEKNWFILAKKSKLRQTKKKSLYFFTNNLQRRKGQKKWLNYYQ